MPFTGASAKRTVLLIREANTRSPKFSSRISMASLAWTVRDRKSTRLNSSHANISYAVFCLKKKVIIVPVLIVQAHNAFTPADEEQITHNNEYVAIISFCHDVAFIQNHAIMSFFPSAFTVDF